MALDIVATYTGGTPRFWRYEYFGKEGIFKFWVPHSERYEENGRQRYRSLSPPTTMDIHVEFENKE